MLALPGPVCSVLTQPAAQPWPGGLQIPCRCPDPVVPGSAFFSYCRAILPTCCHDPMGNSVYLALPSFLPVLLFTSFKNLRNFPSLFPISVHTFILPLYVLSLQCTNPFIYTELSRSASYFPIWINHLQENRQFYSIFSCSMFFVHSREESKLINVLKV